MRPQISRGPVGRVIIKSMMTVAVAALLAGCSNSIERFNEAYKNPSDADPVYTAAIPKIKKPMKPRLVQPSYDVASVEDDTIIESPLKRAAVPRIKKPLDYSQAYQPAYKQPKFKKPKLIKPPVDESYDAASADESYVEPALDKPVAKKKFNRPVIAAETEIYVPTPKAGKIAKDGTLKVAEGMTMFSIAKANGVTVDELADANGMNRPYSLLIGQSLRIPGAAVAETPTPKKLIKPAKLIEPEATDVAEVVAPKPLKGGALHTVAAGETLYSLGRKYGVSPFVIADANKLTTEKQLSLGQKIRIPGAKKAIEKPVADDQVAAVENVPVKPKPIKKKAPLSLAGDEDTIAENTDEETAIGEVPKQVAVAKPKIKEQSAEVADAAPVVAGLNLRWPLKGKVISGFGAKPDGLKNEGINIAVPEGTSVRAADGGVVAYAGNELKGYGNLVLIRHPGGYVTAYAHAKELFVKRGDKVARGDVIAKAGQTGAVTSPQLHFEVRKGATALDPIKFISSSTASN